MSVHIEYLDAVYTSVSVERDPYIDGPPAVYELALVGDDGVKISGTVEELRRLVDKISRVLETDYASSASRQYHIETGEFLLVGEAIE